MRNSRGFNATGVAGKRDDVIPFHQAAWKRKAPLYKGEVGRGSYHFALMPSGGYIRNIHVECSTGLGWVALRDVNGAPVSNASERGYRAYDPHGRFIIPFELDSDTGLGSLLDMSAINGYRMDVDAAGAGEIYVWADVWSLPAAQDAYGNPQQQTPPKVGTTSSLFEFPRTEQMQRTGNPILHLSLLLERAPLDLQFIVDDVIKDELRVGEQHIVLYDTLNIAEALPTFLRTKIEARIRPHLDNVGWLMRDVCGAA